MNQLDLTEQYVDKRRVEKGEKAATKLNNCLKHWRGFIQDGQVTAAKLDEFTTWLRAKALKATTCNLNMATVKACLKWQRRIGKLELSREALEDWKRLAVERPIPEVLKPDVINSLLKTAAGSTHRSAQRWRVFLLLSLGLGARPGETFNIKAEDVDLERKEVKVWGYKTGVQRRVPYFESPSLVRLMPFLCGARPEQPFVRLFRLRSFHTLCKLAGQDAVKMKTLRSTADAYIASGSKMAEYLIASRFGHSTKVAMAHYREPIYNVEGDTLESWMQSEEGFKACTDSAMAYKYRRNR